MLERAGQAVGLSPAGLGAAGSQAFIAATVVLMVATPQLTALGARVAPTLEPPPRGRRRRGGARAEERHRRDVRAPSHHVIVAGYGEAARQLVRVLHGSRVPFVITTLSPGGANEAEADGLPVLRGDSARQHTLLGRRHRPRQDGRRCRRRPGDGDTTWSAVARSLAPTARIIVAHAVSEPMRRDCAERRRPVVAEELESIVQLFADVLRMYKAEPDGDRALCGGPEARRLRRTVRGRPRSRHR